MPLYRFNRAKRIPRSGEWEVNTNVKRAVLHPCLPIPPARVAALEDDEPGIAGAFRWPPKVVLACAMASEWTLNASFTDGYTSFSIVDEVMTMSVAGMTLGNRAWAASYAGNSCVNEGSPQYGANDSFLDLAVDIGNLIRLKWSTEDGGLWWPGILVTVGGRAYDSEDNIVHEVNWNVGNGADASLTEGGPVLTVAGEVIPLRLGFVGDNVSVTGTIDIEPTAWLPRA